MRNKILIAPAQKDSSNSVLWVRAYEYVVDMKQRSTTVQYSEHPTPALLSGDRRGDRDRDMYTHWTGGPRPGRGPAIGRSRAGAPLGSHHE